jgi:hypothetical protein
MPETYKDWNYTIRAVQGDDGQISEYSINFHRNLNDWYDEIRYDSHDRHRGRKTLAPHFHMKLRSAFKADATAAVEEIRSIIDNYLSRIQQVIET